VLPLHDPEKKTPEVGRKQSSKQSRKMAVANNLTRHCVVNKKRSIRLRNVKSQGQANKQCERNEGEKGKKSPQKEARKWHCGRRRRRQCASRALSSRADNIVSAEEVSTNQLGTPELPNGQLARSAWRDVSSRGAGRKSGRAGTHSSCTSSTHTRQARRTECRGSKPASAASHEWCVAPWPICRRCQLVVPRLKPV
jgi:hypothetical protein